MHTLSLFFLTTSKDGRRKPCLLACVPPHLFSLSFLALITPKFQPRGGGGLLLAKEGGGESWKRRRRHFSTSLSLSLSLSGSHSLLLSFICATPLAAFMLFLAHCPSYWCIKAKHLEQFPLTFSFPLLKKIFMHGTILRRLGHASCSTHSFSCVASLAPSFSLVESMLPSHFFPRRKIPCERLYAVA